MARPIKSPALPTTPGGWLACYRYRRKMAGARLWSPERLGLELGVSGDTVRRWENGRAGPTAADLRHIAALYNLHPMEAAFLGEAFKETTVEEAPDETRFRVIATQVLSGDYPAYMFDSLFYVRAWNSWSIFSACLTIPQWEST